MYILSGFEDALTSSNIYYTYLLINPNTKLPFYIGKGKNKRCLAHFSTDHLSKNSHKTHTIKKLLKDGYSIIVDIVYYSEIESSCLLLEEFLIKSYGRRDNNTGILTNLTNGGDGVIGATFTPEQLVKRSKRMMGSGNHMYDKNHSDHSKKMMSVTRKKKFKNKETLPTRHSDEHKHNLTIHNPGGVATAIPIYQIDPTTGNVITEWSSASNAATTLGLASRGNINSAATTNKHRISYGYYWRYATDPEVVNNSLINIVELNNHRLKTKRTTIRQTDDFGNIIKIWDTIDDLSLFLNRSVRTIYDYIKYKKAYNGYYYERF